MNEWLKCHGNIVCVCYIRRDVTSSHSGKMSRYIWTEEGTELFFSFRASNKEQPFHGKACKLKLSLVVAAFISTTAASGSAVTQPPTNDLQTVAVDETGTAASSLDLISSPVMNDTNNVGEKKSWLRDSDVTAQPGSEGLRMVPPPPPPAPLY